jgi:hypothetical protein
LKTGMGKPLFKAPDGGRFEILWKREDLTQGELQQETRTSALLNHEVRPCLRRSGFAQAG